MDDSSDSNVSFPVANSIFVDVPRNVVMKFDSAETIDLACKSDCQCNVQWYVRKNHSAENEIFYNGYFLRPDAKSFCTVITDEPGKCYLRTNLTNSAEAAKTYICLEPGTLDEVSADLIWIGMFNNYNFANLCSVRQILDICSMSVHYNMDLVRPILFCHSGLYKFLRLGPNYVGQCS